jgi:hypothetical protein
MSIRGCYRTIRVRKGVDHRTFASVGDGAGPATGVITLPQASVTTGATGTTASAGQFTVEAHQQAEQNQVCRSCTCSSIHDCCLNNP